MREATLSDGLKVWCLRKSEALVLDHHVQGYLSHGIDIHDGDTILDVGANIGIFGIRAVQQHRNTRVFAFEPIPDIFSVLHKNATTHGEGRLIALNCGASTESSTAHFTYFPRSPALSTSDPEAWEEDPKEFAEAVAGATRTAPMWYARLVPRWLNGWLANHLRGGAQTVECQLRPISDVIDEHDIARIDLLKVDCEGAELTALMGIRDAHWPRVQKIVVEIHDRDGRRQTIEEMLIRHGLSQITVEKEAGFEQTRLVNLFATRPGVST